MQKVTCSACICVMIVPACLPPLGSGCGPDVKDILEETFEMSYIVDFR